MEIANSIVNTRMTGNANDLNVNATIKKINATDNTFTMHLDHIYE